jgi:hypothetical protein
MIGIGLNFTGKSERFGEHIANRRREANSRVSQHGIRKLDSMRKSLVLRPRSHGR